MKMKILRGCSALLLLSSCLVGDASDDYEDVEEVALDEGSRASSFSAPCNDATSGLCVGTSNLYFGGQFNPGHRYPRVNGENDKSRVCAPSGACVPASEAVTYGTLSAFAKYANQANLTIVSLQELPPDAKQIGLHLGPNWAVACVNRVAYRKDRVEVRGEPLRPGADPAQLSPICALRFVKKSAPDKEFLFVGGGLLGDADDKRSPGGALATWVENVRHSRPVVVGLDMNGSAPGDGAPPMNPRRFLAMKEGGHFADTGQRNTVVGPVDRTLDYLWVKGAKHTGSRGFLSGGSDHVWIWSRISF